jgi:hypothetical protein
MNKRTLIPLLFLLLALVGCGSEEFGTVPQSTTSNPDSVKAYEQLSCSSYTLIKPKVDILYVVDNSASSFYLSSDIKNAVKNTVNSISKQFDYRMIGTTLIPDSTPYDDYQIMTNSMDPLTAQASSRKVISSSELTFFTNPDGGSNEAGIGRVIDFMSNNPDNLFRQNAYHIVVLVSNGRDTQVEVDPLGTGQTKLAKNPDGTTVFSTRLASFNSLKASLNSQQLRLFAVTPKQHACKEGWRGSLLSYVKMANQLYDDSLATDNNSAKDSYDLCTGTLSTIFTAINNSIKQVVIPHSYKYWPITFAKAGENVDFNQLQVYKVTGNSAPVLLPSSTYAYRNIPAGVNTRVSPSEGEYQAGPHFVEFNTSSYITYPDCVQIRSVSKTEYFGYVVLPREPKPETISLRINGSVVPQSASNGWTYIGNSTRNIKVPYPNAGDDEPAVVKSGFMLQLNGTGTYYKSGDSVEVNYIPAGI